jgi:hypothetical protein
MWKKHKTVFMCLSLMLMLSGMVNANAAEIPLGDAVHRAFRKALSSK